MSPVRVLVTCSRTWDDWEQARDILAKVHSLAPHAILVSGHAKEGDRGLERIWEGLGGWAEQYPVKWHDPCRPECLPFHRKGSGDGWCPAAGDYRNQDMADLPGVALCLAFLKPCELDRAQCDRSRETARSFGQVHPTHGAGRCANYAEFEVRIPTRRFWAAPIPRA